jgi:hypothetical protein
MDMISLDNDIPAAFATMEFFLVVTSDYDVDSVATVGRSAVGALCNVLAGPIIVVMRRYGG